MFFNLLSVSSMILIGLSNQHVLGRLIICWFSLSKHNRASRGIYSRRISFLKQAILGKDVRPFASSLHKPEIKEYVPHPTATPALQTPIPDFSEKDTEKKNQRTNQTLQEKCCILSDFSRFYADVCPHFITSFFVSRKRKMREQ